MRLMKTKESLSTANSVRVTLDVPVPDNIHFHFSSREVQTAFGHFLLENPHVMGLVFEHLTKQHRQEIGQSQISPWTRNAKVQKEKVLASLSDLADDDSESSPRNIQQTLELLENHKPSRVKVNSTQLLRDIRDNG
jgi:hypothetical protein